MKRLLPILLLALLAACGRLPDVRYLLVPLFGRHLAVDPDERLTLLLSVKSDCPIYVPGHMDTGHLVPFHIALDYWDSSDAGFRPIQGVWGVRSIDAGPLPIYVQDMNQPIVADISRYYGALGKMVRTGTIRCRVRIPLCTYKERSQLFTFLKSAESESFEIIMNDGLPVSIRLDTTPISCPGGLSPAEADAFLSGHRMDYESIGFGLWGLKSDGGRTRKPRSGPGGGPRL